MNRLKPEQRKAQILCAGAIFAEKSNIYRVKLFEIANISNCSSSTVVHYFGGLHQWRDEVVKNAIKCEQLHILAQAIVTRDPLVDDVSPELRERALISRVAV